MADLDATETSRHNLALAYSAIDTAPAAERTEAATARPEDNESTYGEPIEVQSLEQQSMLNPKDTSPLSTLFSSESPAETTEPTPLLTSSFAAQAGYNSTTGETEANYQPIFGGMFMPGARTVNQTNR